MSNDKIAEIRKRQAFAEEHKSVICPSGFSWTYPGWQAHNDRTALLAEIERLTRERDEARAEVARLRGALQYMVNVCPAIDPDGDLAHELARNTLEGKP